jgi:hypothetical protein
MRLWNREDWGSSKASDSCSRGAQFASRSQHWLSWLMIPWSSSIFPAKNNSGIVSRSDHGLFFPVIQSINQPTNQSSWSMILPSPLCGLCTNRSDKQREGLCNIKLCLRVRTALYRIQSV